MRRVRRVLIALRPRAYREALAQAIKRARPLVAVHVLDPDILDYEVRYLEPQVVICEQITPAVRECAICWVETETVPDISLAELISIVDRAEDLTRIG